MDSKKQVDNKLTNKPNTIFVRANQFANEEDSNIGSKLSERNETTNPKISIGEENKTTENNNDINNVNYNDVNKVNIIVENSGDESGIVEDNENLLEKIYEESQSNLESYLIRRLKTDSTDGFGNYIATSPTVDKKVITYKTDNHGVSPRKIDYSKPLSPSNMNTMNNFNNIRDSLNSQQSALNNSQLVSINVSQQHMSKVSNREESHKFFEEAHDSNENVINRWEQTQKIAKTERAKVKYNKINFNREDKIFPITPKTHTDGFNFSINNKDTKEINNKDNNKDINNKVAVSPIVRMQTFSNLGFKNMSDNDLLHYNSNVKKFERSQSMRHNQQPRREPVSTIKTNPSKKGNFVTHPSNKGTLFAGQFANGNIYINYINIYLLSNIKIILVMTQGPFVEKKTVFNKSNRNERFDSSTTPRIQNKKSDGFIKIHSNNIDPNKNNKEISNEHEEYSELGPDNSGKIRDNDSKINKTNTNISNNINYKLNGFENEGYKRKCSLNSEIYNQAMAKSKNSSGLLNDLDDSQNPTMSNFNKQV